MTEIERRAIQYKKLVESRPTPGVELTSKSGESVDLVIKYENTKVAMYLNTVVDSDATGWYLTGSSTGLRVLVDPECIKKMLNEAGKKPQIKVTKVRILRHAMSGRGLICEVLEWTY